MVVQPCREGVDRVRWGMVIFYKEPPQAGRSSRFPPRKQGYLFKPLTLCLSRRASSCHLPLAGCKGFWPEELGPGF